MRGWPGARSRISDGRESEGGQSGGKKERINARRPLRRHSWPVIKRQIKQTEIDTGLPGTLSQQRYILHSALRYSGTTCRTLKHCRERGKGRQIGRILTFLHLHVRNHRLRSTLFNENVRLRKISPQDRCLFPAYGKIIHSISVIIARGEVHTTSEVIYFLTVQPRV